MNTQTAVFSDVTPYCVEHRYHLLRGTFCLHLKDTERLLIRRWLQKLPQKHSGKHDVSFYKTVILKWGCSPPETRSLTLACALSFHLQPTSPSQENNVSLSNYQIAYPISNHVSLPDFHEIWHEGYCILIILMPHCILSHSH